MKKSTNISKKQAVSAAVWSVQAEGLKPSSKTIRNLNDYASGKISVSEMRQTTAKNVEKISQTSK